jgi:topoisomerase-4 subunit A
LDFVSVYTFPRVQLEFGKMGKLERPVQEIQLDEFIGVKGFKAKGKRLANHAPRKIVALESLPEPETSEEEEDEKQTHSAEAASEASLQIDIEDDDDQMSLFDKS